MGEATEVGSGALDGWRDGRIDGAQFPSKQGAGGLSMRRTPEKHPQRVPDAQGAQAVLRDLCTAPSVYLTPPKSDLCGPQTALQ